MVDVGRVTAVIDGDIGPLKNALNQAKSQATSAASGIETDFKKGFGSGLQSSVSSITSSMGPLGSAISGVSGGLGLAATGGLAAAVALGALGAAAVSTAADWQSLMAGVSKTTGVEGAELDQLSADLQKIRTETGATAEDIANATVTAGSVGIPSGELAEFTEVALQMGSAFSMSSEAAVSGISAIGNSAKDTGTSWTEFATMAGSSVNVLADSMRTSEEQILTGMTHLGATMGLLKPPEDTIPEWMALVATVQSLGLAGDQAGEAVQDALTYAARNASSKELGIDVAGLLGTSATQLQLDLRTNAPEVLQNVAKAIAALPLEQQAAAMAMFGSTGSKAIALLMGDLDITTGSFDKLGSAIDDSNKAWEEGTSLSTAYGKSQDTFNAATSRLTASLDVAGQKLGTVLLPVLTSVVDALTFGVQAATSFGESISSMVSGFSALGGELLSGENWMGTPADFLDNLDSAFLGALGIEVGDAVAEGTTDGTEEGMAEGSEKAKDDIKKSTKDGVKEGAEEGFDEAAKSYWSNVENLQRQGIQTGYASSATAGTVVPSSNASWKKAAWSTTETVSEVPVGIRHDVTSQGSKYTLRIDGKDTGISRTVDNFDTTPREDLVQSMLNEYGLGGVDAGTVLKLANKPGEAAKLEIGADITIDSYLNFAENLKSEIEDVGVEIGDAFTAGMVPDIDTIDSKLDAIRRLKLYDPDEYERQGAEAAEEYLISLQSALDAYEAAKIAYIAEPGPNTLSDFEKTYNQLQGLADNMPVTLKLKADDEDFIKVLTAYFKNGVNTDWNALGVSNPARYLEYAKGQLSSEVSTYAEQGRTIPEGETLNLFTALQSWFHENYSSLDSVNRTSSALLDQAISKGGLAWDALYAQMGLLSTEVGTAGTKAGESIQTKSTAGAQKIFDSAAYFKLETNSAGQNIAVIGSAAKTDGIAGGAGMRAGGQDGGSAVLAGCQTGAAALVESASSVRSIMNAAASANTLKSIMSSAAVSGSGVSSVYPIAATTKTTSLGFSSGSDLNNFGGVPKGWTTAVSEASEATKGAVAQTGDLTSGVTSLDGTSGSCTSSVSGLNSELSQFHVLAAATATTLATSSASLAASNNLLQYTAEGVSDSMYDCECAISDFAKAQESTAGLFYASYIGPTSGYSGVAGGGAATSSTYTLPAIFSSFANEGYVASPTLAIVGDRPGGEYVVGAARFENAVGKMGSGGITVNVTQNINGSGLSASELSDVLEKNNKALVAEITNAARGF
ncbi:phage tail tape measure protein [Candidatus Pacearchaeota archaeon]|jgi:TP901 family phage tail tape measure protein|nr:phage tail tape measure protein [Candidatus Pacearchaeota archaeon]